MKRRDALKNMLAFIPLGGAFAGITAMGFRNLLESKNEATGKFS